MAAWCLLPTLCVCVWVSVEERDVIFPQCVFVCECILEVSWRETASTTATMTTTTITRCYWDGGVGGGFWLARSASGGVVACGSRAGQGIYVTTNESTIVARSCLLEMRFLHLLLRQEEAGRHIPRTHGSLFHPTWTASGSG